MEKPIIGDEKFWDTTKGTKSFNWKRYGIALNEYIDHLEAEHKNEKHRCADLVEKHHKEISLEVSRKQKHIDELESTLYSEKELRVAILVAAEQSHIMGLPSTKDFKTYKEEQEQNPNK